MITEVNDPILSELAYGGKTLEQLKKKLGIPESELLNRLMEYEEEKKIKISKYTCSGSNGSDVTLTYYELNNGSFKSKVL